MRRCPAWPISIPPFRCYPVDPPLYRPKTYPPPRRCRSKQRSSHWTPIPVSIDRTLRSRCRRRDAFCGGAGRAYRDGHRIERVGPYAIGSVQAIMVDPSGAHMAGADPRRMGYAVGYLRRIGNGDRTTISSGLNGFCAAYPFSLSARPFPRLPLPQRRSDRDRCGERSRAWWRAACARRFPSPRPARHGAGPRHNALFALR